MEKRIAIRVFVIFFILNLVLFICSCASTSTVKRPEPFKIVKTTLAKGTLDKGTEGVPIQPTTSFNTQDKEVVSHVKYVNLLGRHHLKWEWYSPDGNLYYTTGNYTIGTSQNTYAEEGSSSHKISIKGTRAEEYPGKWKVQVYLDDVLAEFTSFTIKGIEQAQKLPDIDFGDYYALVIGINDYRHIPKLRSAWNDAQALDLRAERSGSGDGRIYSILIIATDGSNNSSTAVVKIIVPHDKRKK